MHSLRIKRLFGVENNDESCSPGVVVNLRIFAMAFPGQNQLVIAGRWLHCKSNKLTEVYEFMIISRILYVFSS